MAYIFSATESLGIPEQITLTDDSDSSLVGITERRIYLRLANGNWLDSTGTESSTVTYIVWSISDVSITLSVLSRSTAIDITVNWMTNSTITGTDTVLYCFDLYDYLFAYDLIGAQTSSPGIIQDSTYYSNFSQFIVNLFCAEVAVTTGNDLFSSQQALNRNQLFITQEQYYF